MELHHLCISALLVLSSPSASALRTLQTKVTWANSCRIRGLNERVTSCQWNATVPAPYKDEGTVPHGVTCKVASQLCYECHHGAFLLADCRYGRILKRRKRIWGSLARGFKKFERDFHRSVSVPVVRGLQETKDFFENLGNTPPYISCPRGGVFTANRRSSSVKITWTPPTGRDKEGRAWTRRMSSKGPGSYFGAGPHTVIYKVTDKGGLTDTCTFTITIRVIRCDKPRSPRNGDVSCSDILYGSTCWFSCDSGYKRRGAYSSSCEKDGYFSPSPPICNRIRCGYLYTPSNAYKHTCTDDYYGSTCYPQCRKGYAPSDGARAYCSGSGSWQQNRWTCEDIADPVFDNCPLLPTKTLDVHYVWPVPTATDNSGQVDVKQVKGLPPGTKVDFGAHLIEYKASDAAGNNKTCLFMFEVEQADCPPPSVSDKDMKFTCNDLSVHSVCQLSCRTGTYVQGSKYIMCVQSKNNTSYWQPLEGQTQPRCFKKTCPDLSVPRNGALVCDRQHGGTICQLHCNKMFDVRSGIRHTVTYVCGMNSSNWSPSNVVPDCSEPEYPEEYFLPTEFYYFIGSCGDKEAVVAIKEQFLYNLDQMSISPCYQDACSVQDVDVTCGETDPGPDLDLYDFERKRRAAPSMARLHIRMNFRLENRNRVISPVAARTKLQEYVTQTLILLESNTILDFDTSDQSHRMEDLNVVDEKSTGRLNNDTNGTVTHNDLTGRKFTTNLISEETAMSQESSRSRLSNRTVEATTKFTSEGSKLYVEEDELILVVDTSAGSLGNSTNDQISEMTEEGSTPGSKDEGFILSLENSTDPILNNSHEQVSVLSVEGSTPVELSGPISELVTPTPSPRVTTVTGNLTMFCAPGEVWLSPLDGVCAPCSAGSYGLRGEMECTPCPVSWYQNETGAASCKPCPPHHVTVSPGATSCTALCQKGTFSSSGLEPCFPCPSGSFQDDMGGTTCHSCSDNNVGHNGVPLLKCDNRQNKQNTSLISAEDLHVSEFLLKCESVKCRYFEETDEV